MEITNRRQGTVQIVEIKGSMNALTAPAFDQFFKEAAASDLNDFLILLNGLDYISSAGIRSFLIAAKQVKTRNGRLLFAGMKDAVKEIFAIAGFMEIFRIYDSEKDALKELV